VCVALPRAASLLALATEHFCSRGVAAAGRWGWRLALSCRTASSCLSAYLRGGRPRMPAPA
jgi:hypothetical protein